MPHAAAIPPPSAVRSLGHMIILSKSSAIIPDENFSRKERKQTSADGYDEHPVQKQSEVRRLSWLQRKTEEHETNRNNGGSSRTEKTEVPTDSPMTPKSQPT